MEQLIEFRGLKLRCYVEATGETYARRQKGSRHSAESWGRNFEAATDRICPVDVRSFFERVGIDPRFGDVWPPHKVNGGRYRYFAVFHFAGTFDQDQVSNHSARIGPSVDAGYSIRVDPDLGLTFSKGASVGSPIVDVSLWRGKLPVVEIFLETTIPWLIDEPEPGS